MRKALSMTLASAALFAGTSLVAWGCDGSGVKETKATGNETGAGASSMAGNETGVGASSMAGTQTGTDANVFVIKETNTGQQ